MAVVQRLDPGFGVCAGVRRRACSCRNLFCEKSQRQSSPRPTSHNEAAFSQISLYRHTSRKKMSSVAYP